MTDLDATAAMAAAAVALVVVTPAPVVGARRRPRGRGGRRPRGGLPGRLVGRDGLADGDVVVVTSKVVAKAEGRVREGDRDEAIADETVRVVARRGPTTIVAHPPRPDPGRGRRRRLQRRRRATSCCCRATRTPRRGRCAGGCTSCTGRDVGVVVTDTAGRAWREGQTDIAIGAAGLRVARELRRPDRQPRQPAGGDGSRRGRRDRRAPPSWPRASSAGRPFAVVRGRSDLVLPVDDDGPGAAALVRADGADLFGYGAREAVLRALAGRPGRGRVFGAPAAADELAEALEALVRRSGRPATVTRSSVTTDDARRGLGRPAWRRTRTAGRSRPRRPARSARRIRPSRPVP